MGVTNHFIVEEELQSAIINIMSITQSNQQYVTKISEELSTLEQTININSKPVSNKKHNVESNLGLFKKNCEGATETFTKTIEKYKTSVQNAKSYIDSQKSNLGGM